MGSSSSAGKKDLGLWGKEFLEGVMKILTTFSPNFYLAFMNGSFYQVERNGDIFIL